ncbi:bacterioferritin [Fuerstiella marisgermanici]|uniref:Bacterioferritin n=1 Tax=Fuerstiella marisgermanici TaxID=1891926 RepID=A0A1P8WNC1_9PLAN|nr:bacterioferritin [Fuerstiella marisgermanici]APZ95566.1 Bacterioferritin [Fuerstiella marisgermanici]
MKGNEKVIEALNAGLTIELTAINQYFIQAKMCKDWGFHKLHAHHYEESIEEMKHAEYLIDRILFLEGVPEIARYDVIRVGSDVKEQLENDLKLEVNAVNTYNEGVKLAAEVGDAGSKEIMERIVVESEESVDWLESQLHLIETVGLQLYLAGQVGESAGE